MSKQKVIVDRQDMTIDDVCHVARHSDTVRLCDAPDFIDRINKGVGFIDAQAQELHLYM